MPIALAEMFELQRRIDRCIQPGESLGSNLIAIEEALTDALLDDLIAREQVPEWFSAVDSEMSPAVAALHNSRATTALLAFVVRRQTVRVLRDADDSSSVMLRASAWNYLARWWWQRGLARIAAECYRSAASDFHVIGDMRHYALNQVNLAECLRLLGRPPEALPIYEAAKSVLREAGTPIEYARCQTQLAACLGDLGRPEHALRLYGQAEPVLREQGTAAEHALCQTNLATCLTQMGRIREALNLYEPAGQIVRAHGEAIDIARWQQSYATCLLNLGQYSAADPLFEAAESVLRMHGLLIERAFCHMNHAACLASLGRPSFAGMACSPAPQRVR